MSEQIEFPPTPMYWGLYFIYRLISLCYTLAIIPINILVRVARFLPTRFCEWITYFAFRPIGIMMDLITLPIRLLIYIISTPIRGAYQLITIGVLIVRQLIKIPYIFFKTIFNVMF